MIPGLSDEENVREMQHILGVSEARARFIVAIEKGEITGDVVDVDGGDETPDAENAPAE